MLLLLNRSKFQSRSRAICKKIQKILEKKIRSIKLNQKGLDLRNFRIIDSAPALLGHAAGTWAKPNPLFDDGDRTSNESGDDEFVGVEDQDDFTGYAGKDVINLLNPSSPGGPTTK